LEGSKRKREKHRNSLPRDGKGSALLDITEKTGANGASHLLALLQKDRHEKALKDEYEKFSDSVGWRPAILGRTTRTRLVFPLKKEVFRREGSCQEGKRKKEVREKERGSLP